MIVFVLGNNPLSQDLTSNFVLVERQPSLHMYVSEPKIPNLRNEQAFRKFSYLIISCARTAQKILVSGILNLSKHRKARRDTNSSLGVPTCSHTPWLCLQPWAVEFQTETCLLESAHCFSFQKLIHHGGVPGNETLPPIYLFQISTGLSSTCIQL